MDKDDKLSVSEGELFEEYKKTNSKELYDLIIRKYDYIPTILARRYMGRGIEYDDIYQIACIGLMKAIGRYNVRKGVKFATFATPTIIGEIKRYFRDKGNFIKVPRRIYEIFNKASKIRNARMQEDGETLSTNDLADSLGVPIEQINMALEWGDNHFVKSLEQFIYHEDDEEKIFSNIIGVEDDSFLMIENQDFIETFMNSLSEREKQFVKYRYYDDMTQLKIAKLMNISQMNVSRMEKKILTGLKKMYFEAVNA